ncbi:hypothetical protein JHK87_015787 [Glycine soja]|nr:hypothetical protein JHK87_015787 [Glycine soja]
MYETDWSATVSIDDFYLTAEGQNKLREANPGNALLENVPPPILLRFLREHRSEWADIH